MIRGRGLSYGNYYFRGQIRIISAIMTLCEQPQTSRRKSGGGSLRFNIPVHHSSSLETNRKKYEFGTQKRRVSQTAEEAGLSQKYSAKDTHSLCCYPGSVLDSPLPRHPFALMLVGQQLNCVITSSSVPECSLDQK